ncbi:DDE-TNP-IS1595 domain-containing protein [Vairimorpha necatrix]|uniref:DDE-TNP-IS1595 domain-containing protein n=1 Tax=Vairimorpha necatrix TaxID=6039 RepID=A0AAX4JAT2_9MICR
MEERIQTREELENIYYELKIEKAKRKCGSCGSEMKIKDKKSMNSRCKWTKCKFNVSVWKDTFFQHSRLDHITVLQILNMWILGYSRKSICQILGCSRQSISNILKKLKEIDIYQTYLASIGIIGGNNTIVEIDESKIGKNKYNRGQPVKGFWCFGIVERTIQRRIIFIYIEKRDQITLTNLLLKYVDRNSTIYSDMWRAY